MKTIKEKVEFVCVPVDEYGCYTEEHEDEIKNIPNILDWFLLSEITEEQASLLVETLFDRSYRDYSKNGIGYESFPFETAKESLFSLLKANGCWTKEWFDGTTVAHDTDEAYKWQQAPDDYLLIIKQ